MGTGLSPGEILLNLDRPNHFGAFCGAFWRNLLIRCMYEFDPNSFTMCKSWQAEQKSYKAKVDSWVEITHVAQVSAVEFEHLTLTPWTDFGQRAPLNWHVENRAEITFERKDMAKEFQRLPPTPTVSTNPDLDMALPTRPDIGRHRELKMLATKPELIFSSGCWPMYWISGRWQIWSESAVL